LPLQRRNLFRRQQFLHLFLGCLTAECNDRTKPIFLQRKRTSYACQMRHLMTRIVIEQEYYRGAAGWVRPFLVRLRDHAFSLSLVGEFGDLFAKNQLGFK
jgi:hypothetical protein